MGVNAEQIKSLLMEKLQATDVMVADIGGCGSSFEVVVVSPQFEGRRLLDRQRLVNAALSDVLPDIHALTMKCRTPAQQQQDQQQAAGAQ